ncbi:hypothetical protein ACQR1I_35420 [Bradyrhizobium sp. HKCCYLS2038]|uniref:hypothetical protein n=1 Tax=unclassified Bradyrhizobium TaxID=2631580 RepID=UPI003EBEA88E
MQVIGHLTDKGILMIDGAAKGEVTYDITVYQDKSFKSAAGTLEGSMNVIVDAFNAGKPQLRLHDGQVIDIILRETRGEHATIQVSGPISGF